MVCATISLAGARSRYAAALRPEQVDSGNAITTFGYALDYDAIVTVGGRGCQAKLALEYERTAKSARKYCVYLASNYHLLNFITQFFEGSRKPIHFGLLDDFRQQRLGMRVIDCTRTHRPG